MFVFYVWRIVQDVCYISAALCFYCLFYYCRLVGVAVPAAASGAGVVDTELADKRRRQVRVDQARLDDLLCRVQHVAGTRPEWCM